MDAEYWTGEGAAMDWDAAVWDAADDRLPILKNVPNPERQTGDAGLYNSGQNLLFADMEWNAPSGVSGGSGTLDDPWIFVYNGSAASLAASSVSFGAISLVGGKDYRVDYSYADGAPQPLAAPATPQPFAGALQSFFGALATADTTNVTGKTVKASINGINDYLGESPNAKYFKIAPKGIAGAAVTVPGSYTYDGSAKEPKDIMVVVGGITLAYGRDFIISFYADNTNAGKATATVTGIGNYAGSASGEFTIAKGEAPNPTGLKGKEGDRLSSVKLPEGWSWEDHSAILGKAGTHKHKASYAGDANHDARTGVELEVLVSGKDDDSGDDKNKDKDKDKDKDKNKDSSKDQGGGGDGSDGGNGGNGGTPASGTGDAFPLGAALSALIASTATLVILAPRLRRRTRRRLTHR
jgi:hypothetical protein